MGGRFLAYEREQVKGFESYSVPARAGRLVGAMVKEVAGLANTAKDLI